MTNKDFINNLISNVGNIEFPSDNMNYNVIFLDFDGCLTSVDSGTHYYCMDDLSYKPCKKIVDKIKKLCDETNSKICLTTNWRKYEDSEKHYYVYKGIRFPSQLPKLKKMLKNYLIDNLPVIKKYVNGYEIYENKSVSLKKWFEINKDFTGKFVIFDDSDWNGFHKTRKYGINKHFIHIDFKTGITDEDIDNARKILNG